MEASKEVGDIGSAATAGNSERVDHLLQDSIGDASQFDYLIQMALFKAIQRGHSNLVRRLLRRWAADPNHVYTKLLKITPLGIAARSGHSDIVADLLETGADPDLPEQRFLGCRPLYYAVKAGHRQIVELLFRAGASRDSRISSTYCALACAVREAHWDIVRLLVCNPDVNSSFLDGETLTTALCLAVQSIHSETVELLLTRGADPNRCSRGLRKDLEDLNGTSIDVAARSNSQEIIELLLTAGANPDPVGNQTDRQPAIVAARLSTWPVLIRLLTAIKEISGEKRSNSLLPHCSCAAADACNVSVFQELLKFPSVVDFLSKDSSVGQVLDRLTMLTKTSGRVDILCQLLDLRNAKEKQEYIDRAITNAALAEQEDIVRQLLDWRSPTDCEKIRLLGRILSKAVDSGIKTTVQMLINLGLRPAVDLNATEREYLVMEALERANPQVLSILLENDLSIAKIIEHKPDRLVRCLDSDAANSNCSTLRLVLCHLTPGQTQSVAHAAIAGGFVALTLSLVANFVDLSCRSADTDHWTLLMRAADSGYVEIVKALLANGADAEETVDGPRGLQSALDIARRVGHQAIANLLDGSRQLFPWDQTEIDSLSNSGLTQTTAVVNGPVVEPAADFLAMLEEIQVCASPAEDAEMSGRLHLLLLSSGFTQERAQFQCQMADFLQKLASRVHRVDMRVMTGSYSDGWGNSLVQATGKTARDSDIDWTVIQEGEKFHLFFGCECRDVRRLRLDVVEGHARIGAHAGSQPAVATPPSGIRPAQDTCYAYMCCSSFHTHRINALISDSFNSEGNVHLVRATRPDKTAELRVSYSFQEKKVLRNLTTVQGQLFILLKFLFKRLIPKTWKSPGLKTYHAKTLLFFMLERKEDSDDWKSENLVPLFRESLLLMLQLTANEAKPEVCMPHFFLEGAPLFFKCATVGSPTTKLGVFECIKRVLLNLTEFEGYLIGHVKPLGQRTSFYFYPFTLLPLTTPSQETKMSYFADIYNFAYWRLIELQDLQLDQTGSFFDKLKCADNLACMKCARVVLEALAHLKLGDESSASQALRQLIGHKAKRLWDPSQTLNVSGHYGNFEGYDFEEHEYEVLRKNDWAWKFCFVYSPERIKLDFLPKAIVECCVSHISQGIASHSYVNFYSLWRCLNMHMSLPHLDRDLEKSSWFTDLEDDADYEELFAFSIFCSDSVHLRICAERIRTFLGADISMVEEARVRQVEEKAASVPSVLPPIAAPSD